MSQVWPKALSYLKDGISLIPVKEVDKTPFFKWKDFQSKIATEGELWTSIEFYGTSSLAIICGKVSGNIEVIDVDVKYKPGIDAILMNDIRNFYPDLFSRLRIHKTPSGGFHIIYRVGGHEVPGNLKLAGRPTLEAEIELQKAKGVKRPNKEVNFLETRGEGGYILSDLCNGYTLHKDNPIPVITWEERCSLITLCQTYNEIIKEAPKPKPNKSQESIYDENPFEHYNNTVNPTELLSGFGWKFSHENPHYIWYTRPDKDKGVSASWNKSKRIFYIFTSSTELQESRGYNPATVLSELKFDGDKSKTYYFLTQNGFGKVKKQVEQGLVKKAALSGSGIPANFSPDAKKTFEDLKISLHDDHPHGIFWEQDENDRFRIDRLGLYEVANKLGFATYRGDIVRIKDRLIYKVTPRLFYDTLRDYIKEEDGNLYKDICNAYEAFIQRSGDFTISRINQIDENNILKDTYDTCYKLYINTAVKITADGYKEVPYSEIIEHIWHDKIMQRKWDMSIVPSEFKYLEFLHYAIGINDQVKKVIGYLSHDNKDENTGYIITLVEKCPDPKMGGGSGKNIFGNILRNTTTVCTVAGSQVKFSEKLLQSWNGERVFFMADVPKKFDFSYLKEMSTGYGLVKKLWKDDRSVGPDEMPKLLVNTNFSFDDSDGGLKRRIIPLEFTDFFTRCGGVDVHFNCMFPTSNNSNSGWTEKDWMGFDCFIAECVQQYLAANCKITPTELSHGGWEKQFKQQFGQHTFEFINENFERWTNSVFISTKEFNNEYKAFREENNLKEGLSGITMNMALKSYCERYGYVFNGNKQHSITKDKGKNFERAVTN
ncbi:Bifunctional DNA primase/polymerase [Mucilaginibacter paludis DSM 18603]|uniref:Bifunctional DNA primase/polymerase n=1 Tax=Mucilaginibacter paludis DSM 18603 TaxID=714943 RepID=H1Y7C3_9SPHI|nr:Bifunctional DNA primase/polymerase [Mucilaginibacter paludis DSM 18603]